MLRSTAVGRQHFLAYTEYACTEYTTGKTAPPGGEVPADLVQKEACNGPKERQMGQSTEWATGTEIARRESAAGCRHSWERGGRSSRPRGLVTCFP